MRATRITLLACLLTALIYAAGEALAGIPNVEVVTLLVFIAGYLLGPWWGAVVGAAGMGAHSLFNAMGTVPPPVWIAQVACYALIGFCGAWMGPRIAAFAQRTTRSLVSAATGLALVIIYQLVVNVVSFATFAANVPVWTYVWGGLAFAAIQMVWNAALFFVTLPPTLRVLDKARRELGGKGGGVVRATIVLLAALSCVVPLASRAAEVKVVAPPAPIDSVRAAISPAQDFGVIARENFLRRHAFSLDNFLELMPDGVVARLGPIGNEAYYSRWGIGRGRALVIANGIPLNDPQDGTAPFVHIATSGIASLTLDPREKLTFAPAIEGSVSLRDMVAPDDKPHTFIELSKASNDLRQRRVRFGSEAGPVGLDVSYDEVLDDGYDFDANDVVLSPTFGEANTRNAGIALRGDLAEHTNYNAGIRRFRSSTTGDLVSAANEGDRSGHLAWAGVRLGTTQAVIYGRGYKTTRPDSTTINESVGGTVAWDLQSGGATLHMFALGEHTNATQEMGGAGAHNQLNQGNAGASTELASGGFTFFGHGLVGGDTRVSAWGAGAGVRREIPLGDVTLSAQRTFRMPSIAERYLPLHNRDFFTLQGTRTLDPETALEGDADWTIRRGGFMNRVRAAWMRSEDYITFAPVAGDSVARRAANSLLEPEMSFFEERFGAATNIGALQVLADAGGRYSTGDRTGLFLSVPRTQANASLLCGMELFQKSSALYVGGEYAWVDERRDYNGVALPSYSVVNVSLVGRLIDARFYVKWLNVLDQPYQTMSGYLMTPSSVAYGIEWTLFD